MTETVSDAPIPEDLVGTRQGIFYLLQSGAEPAGHDPADVPAFAARADEAPAPLRLTQPAAAPRRTAPRTYRAPEPPKAPAAPLSEFLDMDDFHFNL
ncbi:hypothetical protein SAMN05216196_101983 [Lutimaribacter pacificus]|uniref:Uncharacterized protein n=1 Tax=Lutimaribacter pacificus TaxID=391948 RepID=A0A1H0CL35_9RHOB|nr:hypothetical protein [Lutimaribacter pacificus]SDN58596.1 hypothetical protein SAMN05216196_101983 [Lutimaribacter pacificus]SHJ43362.1 hypothetical protein SAMN05444142_101234 [Lutimaribacter pacificus]